MTVRILGSALEAKRVLVLLTGIGGGLALF
jgi:hypothetical protein